MPSRKPDEPVVELDLTEPTRGSFKFKADLAANNPCYHESNLSYKCLEENNYNMDACKAYQENYKMCRKFWDRVHKDRKQRGVFPYLPAVSERQAVKAEYDREGDRLQK